MPRSSGAVCGKSSVVARENQARVHGLVALTDRERQVVTCLALGQSTKETAYALGISDATVRVLLGRAAAKLGTRSRIATLNHPEVQRFATDSASAARCAVPDRSYLLMKYRSSTQTSNVRLESPRENTLKVST
ncbi:MAG: helix-turn-helix transcriptional regulator [Myxococcota bacterium]|nr:helix-turn-helix transcriptional regulator [Myxococcota bacterium]